MIAIVGCFTNQIFQLGYVEYLTLGVLPIWKRLMDSILLVKAPISKGYSVFGDFHG